MRVREDPPVGAEARVASCCSAYSWVAAGRHPLDPLNGDEMAHAAKIVAAAFGRDGPIRFERLEIEEPDKAVLPAWKPGAPWDRKVRFSIYPAGRVGVTEGILS